MNQQRPVRPIRSVKTEWVGRFCFWGLTMRIYLFVKNDCPLCAPAKGLYEELDRTLPGDTLPALLNVDEDPGALAEFQFHGFLSVPTIAIVDEDTDTVVHSWSGGNLPAADEIIESAKAAKRKE